MTRKSKVVKTLSAINCSLKLKEILNENGNVTSDALFNDFFKKTSPLLQVVSPNLFFNKKGFKRSLQSIRFFLLNQIKKLNLYSNV